jgi:hypothetical protein
MQPQDRAAFKPLQYGFLRNLRVIDDLTLGEVSFRPGNVCSRLVKGAAARLFKHPCPAFIVQFFQLAGRFNF